MVEEMTVVHEGFDAKYAENYAASAAVFGTTPTSSENTNQ
jgi:hypothetical protein